MTNTTALLKASIEYEQSKSDVMNLLNHKRQDLSFAIDAFQIEIEACQHSIESRQYLLDNAEDMDEGLEVDQRARQSKERAKLESLLAWRMIFLSAWQQVKR